jgi:DNA processing protein
LNIFSLGKPLSEFYKLGKDFWNRCDFLTKKEIQNLSENDLKVASNIFERCITLGQSIVSLPSIFYPEFLRQISNPPCVLYVKGNVRILSSKFPISVIGSRNATCYGSEMAYEISKEFANLGVTVISGGALGADSSAHKGAIEGGGKTISVLACGLDFPYLEANLGLRRRIVKSGGALISEFPPGTSVLKYSFAVRNRIISGISLGVVVVEAGLRSGAVLTASFAAEQGRDVFVVPVLAQNPLSDGVFALIRDGAKVIRSAREVVDDYKNINANFIPEKSAGCSTEFEVNQKKVPDEFIPIIDAIKKGNSHIDEIKNESRMSIKKLLPLITKMEILNLIESLPGRRYKIK